MEEAGQDLFAKHLATMSDARFGKLTTSFAVGIGRNFDNLPYPVRVLDSEVFSLDYDVPGNQLWAVRVTLQGVHERFGIANPNQVRNLGPEAICFAKISATPWSDKVTTKLVERSLEYDKLAELYKKLQGPPQGKDRFHRVHKNTSGIIPLPIRESSHTVNLRLFKERRAQMEQRNFMEAFELMSDETFEAIAIDATKPSRRLMKTQGYQFGEVGAKFVQVDVLHAQLIQALVDRNGTQTWYAFAALDGQLPEYGYFSDDPWNPEGRPETLAFIEMTYNPHSHQVDTRLVKREDMGGIMDYATLMQKQATLASDPLMCERLIKIFNRSRALSESRKTNISLYPIVGKNSEQYVFAAD